LGALSHRSRPPFLRFATVVPPSKTIAPIESIEDLRRKFNAPKAALKVKKEISQPDRIIGRAYAEIEAENRDRLEAKRLSGTMNAKERAQYEQDQKEIRELGLDPRHGRWGEFLKKKQFKPKEKQGMPEFRMGTPLQSALAKAKNRSLLNKKRKKKRK